MRHLRPRLLPLLTIVFAIGLSSAAAQIPTTAVLDPTVSRLLWSSTGIAGRHCAVGADGTVAALVGNEAAVYGADGVALGRWTVGGTAQNDLAVDGQNHIVIVTGYTQVSSNLQVPFIRAYSYNGTVRWRSYDFPVGTVGLGTADTRGERVAIGRDGKLYFVGSINGGTGASSFNRDPHDASKGASDRTVVTDMYTNPSNVGAVKILWLGRFTPTDGSLMLAQSLLTRRSDEQGNSLGAAGLSADADGTVYLAGGAAAFLANRDAATVGGVRVGPYGGDAYALVIAPDFTERWLWVPFTAPTGGSGSATAISVRGDTVAMAATLSSGAFISVHAVQPAPGGGADAYLAVWPK